MADQIRRRISVGDLRPGQRIESSRKLALESAFIEADLDLHAFAAGIAGSPLHAALERMAGIGLRTDMTGRARRLALDPELDELHRTLVDAIDASDADAARTAARAIAVAEGAAPD